MTLALATLAPAASGAEFPYAESFTGTDAAPWPAPWFPGSSHVTAWDLQQGRARLNGDPSFVARMLLPGFSEVDVEAEVTFEFEDFVHQGIGFYVRQNGGTLQEYLPHGQGYAMFLKGPWAWPEDLGLWREIGGVETQFAWGYDPIAGGLQNGVRYRLRFRVTQSTPGSTLLQAKVWPEAATEPAAWTIEATDFQAQLQGTAGSFAIDIYNHLGAGHVFLDDIVIRRYPYPLAAGGAPPSGGLALSAPRPHPIRSGARVDLVLPRASEARLAVHDLAGRRVALPIARWLAAGTTTWSWDGTGEGGRRLAAGVYFMQLAAGGESASRRIVIAN